MAITRVSPQDLGINEVIILLEDLANQVRGKREKILETHESFHLLEIEILELKQKAERALNKMADEFERENPPLYI